MRRLRILGLLLSTAFFGFLPVTDHFPHPGTVAVQVGDGWQIPLNLEVVWFDLRLDTNCFSRMVELDGTNQAVLPDVGVRTRLWRLGLKRVLSRFDAWSACENCYGPRVDCFVNVQPGSRLPDKMRLAQDRIKQGNRLLINVSLIPNEIMFQTRDFRPQNPRDLLAEARELIRKGTARNIPPSSFGPELTAINPVRVQCCDGALILWMGGKLGYALVPDSDGCPALNFVWVTPTEHPHIYELEKNQGTAAPSTIKNQPKSSPANRTPAAAHVLLPIRTNFMSGAALSARQLETVARLATRCGIQNVIEISTERHMSGTTISVMGDEVTKGRVVTFKSLRIYPESNARERPLDVPADGGFWAASSKPQQEERTIVRIRDREVKVGLLNGIKPAGADRIIDALVNGRVSLTADWLKSDWSRVDVTQPGWIGIMSGKPYIIFTSSPGLLFSFTIEDNEIKVDSIIRAYE